MVKVRQCKLNKGAAAQSSRHMGKQSMITGTQMMMSSVSSVHLQTHHQLQHAQCSSQQLQQRQSLKRLQRPLRRSGSVMVTTVAAGCPPGFGCSCCCCSRSGSSTLPSSTSRTAVLTKAPTLCSSSTITPVVSVTLSTGRPWSLTTNAPSPF